MPFKRFVETGRVAFIADGPYKGKLCTIVDVINQTKVLIDGPETGVPRGQIRLNQLHLTKFRIKFPYTGSTRVVRKAWKDNKVDDLWKESKWAKKEAAKKRRSELTDFDRFKLRYARMMRNKYRRLAFFTLKGAKTREMLLKKKGKLPKGDKKGDKKADKKKEAKKDDKKAKAVKK